MNDTESWLVEWHARFPGATSKFCAHGRPSSYDWLAAHAEPGDAVLDVACGDGFLLERLRARGVARAVGLDLSPAELSAARARLGEGVELVEGRAQALPFEDSTFSLVTSHLALMLMLPAEPVIAEIHRVLRPGGRLAAIIGASQPTARTDAWLALVGACVQRPLEGPPLGDPRMGLVDELPGLLHAFERVSIEPLLLDLSGPPDEIWALFTHTYMLALIPAEHRDAFEHEARAMLASMVQPDGTVPCALDLLAVTAVRAA